MLASSSAVKSTAKTVLSQDFLRSVAVCSVLIFAFFAGELIATLASFFAEALGYYVVLGLILVFAIAPIALGVLYYFRRLLWEQKDSAMVVFKYFSNLNEYKRALKFILMLCAKLVSAALIVFSPCIVISVLSNEKIYKALDISLPIWTSNLWTLNSFIVIIATFILMFVMLKYYLAAFIFVGNDDADPENAIMMSAVISKRTGGDFFGLVLSFAGWILLSFLVAPLVFTLPYFMAAYAVHCRFAITAYNMDVDYFNSSNTPFYSTNGL